MTEELTAKIMKIAVSAQFLLVLWKKISSPGLYKTAILAVQSASWLTCLKIKKRWADGFTMGNERNLLFSWCYQDRVCLCSGKLMPGKRYSWDKSGSLCHNHIICLSSRSTMVSSEVWKHRWGGSCKAKGASLWLLEDIRSFLPERCETNLSLGKPLSL